MFAANVLAISFRLRVVAKSVEPSFNELLPLKSPPKAKLLLLLLLLKARPPPAWLMADRIGANISVERALIIASPLLRRALMLSDVFVPGPVM